MLLNCLKHSPLAFLFPLVFQLLVESFLPTSLRPLDLVVLLLEPLGLPLHLHDLLDKGLLTLLIFDPSTEVLGWAFNDCSHL